MGIPTRLPKPVENYQHAISLIPREAHLNLAFVYQKLAADSLGERVRGSLRLQEKFCQLVPATRRLVTRSGTVRESRARMSLV